MSLKVEDSTIYSFPHAFINKKGEAILITTLDDKRCQRLIQMYRDYQPKNSFQGLPPHQDEACKKWVQIMIRNGVNLVALSFGEGVVGHVVLFPVNDQKCEMLVVVCPQLQNTGIGTELVRCAVQLSDEIAFETIQLSVEVTNFRARHVYKKCGFEYLSNDRSGEVDMALDLKRYRHTMSVSVAGVMNKDVISIRNDQSCKTAMEIFLNSQVASLPVVDADDQLIGIISTTDLMLPSKISKKVGDVLTREVLTVRQECAIAKVIRMLQSRKVHAIPVVDRQRKLLGVVSRRDILAYYAKQLKPDSRN